MIKQVTCPKCNGTGKLAMDKPCFSCNSAGTIDYPQALSQIEFWTDKNKNTPSKINEATIEIWAEIAKSLQINQKEFDTFDMAIDYLKKRYYEDVAYEEVENALLDLSNFCDVHDISITITSKGKLIINE